MRRSIPQILVTGLAVASFLLAGAAVTVAEDAKHEFVGVKKCKTCHKKEEDGAQYTKWLDSRHAKAYETLAGDKAKEFAAAKGIENPQTSPDCLKCHVTAFPVMDDLVNQNITLEEGISCESCHGPGGDYYKKKTMQAIAAGEVDGAELGLIVPDEKTCTGCHNEESPSYKEFNYEEMVKKIAHPKPAAAEG